MFESKILNGQYINIEKKMILHSFYKEWLEKYANDSLSSISNTSAVNSSTSVPPFQILDEPLK